MSKLTKVEELKTKRFVIRKSLIGKNVVITFTNKKQENVSYIYYPKQFVFTLYNIIYLNIYLYLNNLISQYIVYF